MDIAESTWNTKDYNWDSQRMVATHAKEEEENSVGEKTSGASRQDRGEGGDGLSSPGVKSSPSAAPVILDTLKNTGGLKKKVPLTCQVEGCNRDLSKGKEYYQRYRICEDHLKMSCLMKDGVPQRFCQQCGRFHLLSEFDGDKRSCRARLALHNNRRRKRIASEPVKNLKFDDLHRSPTKGRRTLRVGKDGDVLQDDDDSDHVLGHEHGVGAEHSLRHHEDMPPEFNRHIHKVLESLRAIPPSLGGQDEARGYGGMRMSGTDHMASQDTEATLHSLLGELPMGGSNSRGTLTDLARRISAQSPHAGQGRGNFQDSSIRGYGQGHNEAEPLDRMNALEMFTSGRISLDDAKRLLQNVVPQERSSAGGFPEGGSAYGGAGFNHNNSSGAAAEHNKDTFASLAGLGSNYNNQSNYGGQNVLSAAMDFGRTGGPQRDFNERFPSATRENEQAPFNQFGSGSGSGSPGGFNLSSQPGFGQGRTAEVLDSLRGHANSSNFGAGSAGYAAAPEPAAGGGNQNLTEVNEQLMRISLKLAECTPERLPPELRNEIVNILRVQPSLMEGYVRPGCVHLMVDITAATSSASEEETRLILSRFQAALQKWQIPTAVVQVPGGAIKVKEGRLERQWVGHELEDAVPHKGSVRMCSMLSLQRNTIEVAECGGSNDCEFVVRFQGRFFQIEEVKRVRGSSFVSIGPVFQEGVLYIEKYDGNLAGDAEAIVMVQNANVRNEVQHLCKFRGLHRDITVGLNQLLSNIGNVLQFLPVLELLCNEVEPNKGTSAHRLSVDHPFCEERYLEYITSTAQQVLAVCVCKGWNNLAAKVVPVAAAGCVSFNDLVVAVWQIISGTHSKLQDISKGTGKCVLDGSVLCDAALPWLMALSGSSAVDLGQCVSADGLGVDQIYEFLLGHSKCVQQTLQHMGVAPQPVEPLRTQSTFATVRDASCRTDGKPGRALDAPARKPQLPSQGFSLTGHGLVVLALWTTSLPVCVIGMCRGNDAAFGPRGVIGMVLVLFSALAVVQKRNPKNLHGLLRLFDLQMLRWLSGRADSRREQLFHHYSAVKRMHVDIMQSVMCVAGHLMLCYTLKACKRLWTLSMLVLTAQMMCSALPGGVALVSREFHMKHREVVIVTARVAYHLLKEALGLGPLGIIKQYAPFTNSVLFALLLVQRPLLFQVRYSIQVWLVVCETLMDFRLLLAGAISGTAMLARAGLMLALTVILPVLVAAESERALRRGFAEEVVECGPATCTIIKKGQCSAVDAVRCSSS